MIKTIFTAAGLFVSFALGAQSKTGELTGVLKNTQHDFQKEKLPAELKPFLKDLVLVPGGRFVSGFHPGDTASLERVITVASYYVAKTEVTNAQYRTFYQAKVTELGEEKAREFIPQTVTHADIEVLKVVFDHKNYFLHPSFNDYPVTGVSWTQAKAYCEWLSSAFRKKLETDPKLKEKYDLPDFRLPTEMEWEYAAQGGQEGRVIYPWGDVLIGGVKGTLYPCNFGEIKDERGHRVKMMSDDGAMFAAKVASYPANGYGLYDMAGNVNEWVEDVYRAYARGERPFRNRKDTTAVLPARREYLEGDNPLKTENRVVRGGSFMDSPFYLVAAARRASDPNKGSFDTGFRIAMTLVGRTSTK